MILVRSRIAGAIQTCCIPPETAIVVGWVLSRTHSAVILTALRRTGVLQEGPVSGQKLTSARGPIEDPAGSYQGLIYKSNHPPAPHPPQRPTPYPLYHTTPSNCTFFNCYHKSTLYNSILISFNCSFSSDSSNMSTISENALQQAIDAVLAGASLRRASTTHGVPRRTLVRRLEGKLPKR